MKRVILVVISLFIVWPMVVLGNPLTYPEEYILNKIKNQSPGIWNFQVNDDYIPQKGGIKVCKAENIVIVGFYLSQENMDFYNQVFSYNLGRKPLGFEMVIKDHSGVFNRDNIVVYETSFDEDVRYDEKHFTDPGDVYTLAISDPTQLDRNEWHTVTFYFSEHVDVSQAEFTVQVQLVGDLYALKNDFNSYHDQYDADVKVALSNWFFYTNNVGDLVDVGGNNYFNVIVPIEDNRFDKDKFFGWPEGKDTGYDRYLWNMEDPDDQSISKLLAKTKLLKEINKKNPSCQNGRRGLLIRNRYLNRYFFSKINKKIQELIHELKDTLEVEPPRGRFNLFFKLSSLT